MTKQMAIPFALGADGALATVSDPVQSLADRVRALTSTQPGQRVMRTTFGVSTGDVLFAWDPTIGQQQITQRVTDAVNRYEPSARVIATAPVMNGDGSEVLGVNVDISAGDPVVAQEGTARYSVAVSTTGDVTRAA